MKAVNLNIMQIFKAYGLSAISALKKVFLIITNTREAGNIYILLDGLVCSIAGYFYESRRILASP